MYDTRHRGTQPVLAAGGGLLRMYACGPTVYRYAHVGNLRTFLLTDLVRRVASVVHGRQVLVVSNITDVGHLADDTVLPGLGEEGVEGEDKVLAQAALEGRDPREIVRFYTEAYHRDLAALNIARADIEPTASNSIDLMIDLVSRLVDSGHAYVADGGGVFFDARSFPSYGEISGNRLDALRPGHRREAAVLAAGKRFHADWALWRSAGARRQLVWDSPWGPGYPGWHVECSAMSLHHLGERIDVHTGGIDLRFPHHEDERAQSEAVVGHEVVRHWVHGEHLLFDGRKMAKSSGNVVLLTDLPDRGLDPLALRLAFLRARYRTQLDLTWQSLADADRQLARWRALMATWSQSPGHPIDEGVRARAEQALDDDLDTPRVLQLMRTAESDRSMSDGARFELFAYLDRVLALDLARDVGRAAPTPHLPTGAAELIEARARARAAKDWAESDRVREALAALGVTVIDTADGQRWSLATP
ncbi:MAG: cysteine--tRNA ligase [Actinomycetes bacterium]